MSFMILHYVVLVCRVEKCISCYIKLAVVWCKCVTYTVNVELLSESDTLVCCLWHVGMVPYEPELVQLANGDVLSVRTWPCWGMDVKYGKNTDISYGPWADRQR